MSRLKRKLKKIVKILKVMEVYKQATKKPKRIWSRDWLLRRDRMHLGACTFVHTELISEDLNSYSNYLRMNSESFNILLNLIEDRIGRQDTQLRQAISAKFRLTVTLRFLATGESFQSLSFHTRISQSTITKFIPEVLEAIYECLHEKYLKVPSSPEEWQYIAEEFYEQWNVPNTIGAMDGKHIVFRAPRSSGSHYYNYKGTHSVVLLAIVDANYNFLYVDVGTNGRVSDGGVYKDCDFALALDSQLLNLPNDAALPHMEEPTPYVLLADAAFPLQRHILKPFPFRNMTREQRIFNYRISRGRRVVENAFGILANRFRVLLNPINLSRDKVVTVTKACCVLHNFLKAQNPQATKKEVDTELQNGKVVEGLWRQDTSELRNVTYRRGRPNTEVIKIREKFMTYFNTHGRVDWQENMI